MAKPENLRLDRQLMELARLPKKFWAYSVDDYAGDPRALKEAVEYAANYKLAVQNQTGLLLVGPPQSYKTFISVHLARLLMVAGYSISYYTLDFLTDAYFQRTGDNVAFLTRFESDLVIFDKVEETLHKGQRIALNKAISARSDIGPYIVCTSLSDEEIALQYGAPMARLLAQDLLKVHCRLEDAFKAEDQIIRRKAKLKFT